MAPRSRKAVQPAPVLEQSSNPAETLRSLLMKCLDPKASSADVGRLYKVKDQLNVHDWTSTASLELKTALVSCFEARVFYKSFQGINFLALIFNLHPLIVGPISEVLKRVILAFPAPVVQACSQVLFKAWQTSTGGMRIVIEQSITDWMRKALFTGTRTAERVRFLLSELHSATRTKEIDDMLSRYYGPILFRHTKVANWEVRFNAVALLCAAFPVIPPDTTQIQFEEKLTTEFRVLKDSMEDPNESVRKCAVVGSGRILRDFWEVLTIEQIAMILDCIGQKTGKDKNSVKTRMATIDAISLIVDNPLSHGVLMELLPDTKQLIYDESPLVRLKYVELLVKLTKFRTISIPQIVNQSWILSRLAEDHAMSLHSSNGIHRQICVLLSSIMAPSLFASSVEDQVAKSERMAEALPQGFLALISNCAQSTPELDRVRLAVAVCTKAISVAVKNQDDRKMATARILLRGATELLRSTQFANIQNTEDVFNKDSDQGTLATFIYRHVVDRDVSRFLDLCFEAKLPILPDLLDWLSVIDGCRLPLVFTKLEQYVVGAPELTEMTRRVAASWGIFLAGSVSAASADNWSAILSAVRSSQASANLAASAAAVCNELETSLALKDSKPLLKRKSEIASFVASISAKLPNVKFVPKCTHLIKLSLASLLRIHQEEDGLDPRRRLTKASSEFSSLIHRFNIGLISSLTTAPVPPRPGPKKQKTSASWTPESSALVEVAMDPSEIVDLMCFYLDFLLVSSLLTGIALKATKFDDLCRVLFTWIDRDPSMLLEGSSTASGLVKLVQACVESRQSAWAGAALLDGALMRFTGESDLDDLAQVAVSDFGFSGELARLATKISISKANEGALKALGRAAQRNPSSVAESLRQVLNQ